METYNHILEKMEQKFTDLAGYEPNQAADIGIRLKVLAGEIYALNAYLEWIKSQMFPQTAQGIQLDYHAQQQGLTRKPAVKAQGTVHITLPQKAEEEVYIPEGIVCSTKGNNPIRFITTSSATIGVGGYVALVMAEAVEPGRAGNVAAGAVNTLVSLPAHTFSISNNYAYSKGEDEESDEALRERILDRLRNLSNGTNCAFYRDTAKSFAGVSSAGVIPHENGPGTVSLYLAGKGEGVSASTILTVKRALDEAREVNVEVKVASATLQAYDVYVNIAPLPGYEIAGIEKIVKIKMEEYFLNLAVGEAVYLSNLGEIIQHIEGVKSYAFDDFYTQNYKPNQAYLAILRKVAVKEDES